MNPALFERYQQQAQIGLRHEARSTLAAFIASFVDLDDKKRWTRTHLDTVMPADSIRHELYAQVIFPALLDGYRAADPWSLRWLARTAQGFYRAESLWQQIEGKTKTGLLRELMVLCPADDEVRQEILVENIRWLQHAVHEWPAGILHGMNGATLAECDEIRQTVAESREWDTACRHAAFLCDFEGKLNEFVARLQVRRD